MKLRRICGVAKKGFSCVLNSILGSSDLMRSGSLQEPVTNHPEGSEEDYIARPGN